jgi:hypothetical protein
MAADQGQESVPARRDTHAARWLLRQEGQQTDRAKAVQSQIETKKPALAGFFVSIILFPFQGSPSSIAVSK